MMKRSTVWRHENGKYLIIRFRRTHTGRHTDVSWSDDIGYASTIPYLPKRITEEYPLTAVPVEVRVEIIPLTED